MLEKYDFKIPRTLFLRRQNSQYRHIYETCTQLKHIRRFKQDEVPL